MNKKLSPLKNITRPRLRQLREKEKAWVLDCVNEQKSKLKPYSAMKDRYLKYFVVRVPKKIRNFSKTIPDQKNQVIDGEQFKNFLDAKKQKIMESQQNFGAIRNATQRSFNSQNPHHDLTNCSAKVKDESRTQTQQKKMLCEVQKIFPLEHPQNNNKNGNINNTKFEVNNNQAQLLQVNQKPDKTDKENQPKKQVEKIGSKARIISEKIQEQYQHIEQKIVQKIR